MKKAKKKASHELILGAAGRDFHNFNVFFRNNPKYKVVAFTAAQIPGITNRTYPRKLAGKLYTRGIKIYPEEKLSELIKKFGVEEVVLAYSDLTPRDMIDKASIVLANGADFKLMGSNATMLKSKKPVVAICATRTGAGKGTVARRILDILKNKVKVIVIRHPMPYGNLEEQICQRFESYKDFEKYKITVEELEEYEPYVRRGFVIYSGVDYEKILREAEKEGDMIVFESGNNDVSLIKPDLYITVADPLRPEGIFSYPGEINVRLADVIVMNKVNVALEKELRVTERNIREVNPKAKIIKAKSIVSADKPDLIKGKTVVIVEDSPTVTHGSLGFGAGFIAAKKYHAKKIVNPRPYATGSIKEAFKQYSHIKFVLPSLGYTKRELQDLEDTINRIDCDTVVLGTPCDISRLIKINKPIVHVSFELKEIGKVTLKQILDKFLK